jgi:hypothetical protein
VFSASGGSLALTPELPAGSAAAAATPSTTTTTATTATTGAGFCLVHADVATHPLDVLQVINSFGFVAGVGQIHKGETTLASSVPIQGQNAFANFAVLGEEILEIFHFGIEGKVTHEDGHEMNG